MTHPPFAHSISNFAAGRLRVGIARRVPDGGPMACALHYAPDETGPQSRVCRVFSEPDARFTRKRKVMDAIEMLKAQHKEVEALFSKYEELGEKAAKSKQAVFEKIADALAMHATIEEKHFYPAIKAKRTEDILLESLEEHLGIKRIIADLLKLEPSNETFDPKVKVLKEQVEHHVEEEESDMFPKVRKILDKAELTELATVMQQTMKKLEAKGDARKAVPAETGAAPQL
jgi:hemerythrin superfamily protein